MRRLEFNSLGDAVKMILFPSAIAFSRTSSGFERIASG